MVNPVRNHNLNKNHPFQNRLISNGVKFPKKTERFEVVTENPFQTKKLGKILAKEILKTWLEKTLILGLVGDLGGGKTTFLQGFAKGLGIKEKILSPSFIILRRFKIKDLRFKNFYHIDCYRLSNPKEILNLGFREIISNHQDIVAIEWADRITRILPKDALILNFEFIDQKTRKITIKNRASITELLEEAKVRKRTKSSSPSKNQNQK